MQKPSVSFYSIITTTFIIIITGIIVILNPLLVGWCGVEGTAGS